MLSEPSGLTELLDRAAAERLAGRGAEAARLFQEAAGRAQTDGDLTAWTAAALGAASVQVFGAEPGRLPALLYDVLARTTDPGTRCRLAAALARCWAYAGRARRGQPFADQALADARVLGSPDLLVAALDAALAVRWGPDELDVRRALTIELDEVAAHVVDPEARLQAHLWGLQVACERLDLQTMHRQMRDLELLGEDSPRALFFAASRRLMLDLLRGRTDTTAQLVAVAAAAAREACLPDAWMVLTGMEVYSAIQTGDLPRVAEVAQLGEDFAQAEGSTAIYAEAAFWWAEAGHPDRAQALLGTFHGDVLADLPRDVNWMLTLQCVLEAALAAEDRELVGTAAGLLEPYAGRAVVNGGAVMIHGVTDDTLSRAYVVLGRHDEAAALRARALTIYQRIGARWWRERLATSPEPISTARHTPPESTVVHLHPTEAGLWAIGSSAMTVAGLRGFGYLRELVRRPGQPVPALQLATAGQPTVEESGLGEVIDRQALAAYRARLLELDEELEEAESWGDAARHQAAATEREALLGELRAATGLGGRVRTPGSSQERARIAVRKAVTAALQRIQTVDEDLALHLRNSIRTGLVCSYEPEPGSLPGWALDAPSDRGPASS